MAHDKDSSPATDAAVRARIEHLVHEQQTLYASAMDDAAQVRLEQIQVELDQLWDFLRQREAREEFGEDPSGAAIRPKRIVENYEQ